ncbi:SHC2 isoform 5, partial [Pongo abelii]
GPGAEHHQHRGPSLRAALQAVPAQPTQGGAAPRKAGGAGGVGLGGRGGLFGAQLLQQHPREGTAAGRASGLQAGPDTALRPHGPRPGPISFSKRCPQPAMGRGVHWYRTSGPALLPAEPLWPPRRNSCVRSPGTMAG